MELGSVEAGTVLQRAQNAIDRLGVGEKAKAEALRAAQEAFDAARDQYIAEILLTIPIEKIKDITHGRLRLDAIQAAGYATVQDVLSALRFELEELPGVGPATANRVRAAALQLRNTLPVSVRIDPKKRPTIHKALLEAVRRQEQIDRALGEKVPPFFTSKPKLEEYLRLVKAAPDIWLFQQASKFFSWITGKTDEVAGAERALDQLKSLLESPALLDELRITEHIEAADMTSVWESFLERPANFYAYLTKLGVKEADENAVVGSLPSEIVEAVRRQPLDETLLKNVSLRGYQNFGAKYALVQKRSLLGDEMGLGKTVQALAVLAHLATRARRAGLLVVCPAAVVTNWGREIATKSKLIPVVIQGTGEDRGFGFAKWKRQGGVGVMSFESARALHQDGYLAEIELDLLVVDEAHYAKNPQSARSMAVAQLSKFSAHVLFMSGTPLENRLKEFHSLIECLQPATADTFKRAANSAHGIVPQLFTEMVAPVYLRRNQEDVLTELPEKIESDEWLTLSKSDIGAYCAAVKRGDFMGMRRAVTLGRGGKSAKLDRLQEIVEEAGIDGQKVIVFSFFLDVIEAVSKQLENVFGPIHGGVSSQNRQNMIDAFTAAQGPAVLVAQIQSGGTGLNIQAASVVVLMEPQVKPSLESQAIARAHRMGQTRRVQVFRLLAQDSVDERMVEILVRKTALFNDSVRESSVKNVAPDAMDVSDTTLAREVILSEQRRLASLLSQLEE